MDDDRGRTRPATYGRISATGTQGGRRSTGARSVPAVRSAAPVAGAGAPNGLATAVDDRPFAMVRSLDGLPSEAVDAVRYLIASLHREDEAMPARLGFTSALAGEGVTFISQTVAAVMAHDSRQRVCLVDLNWGASASPKSGRKHKRKRKGGEEPSEPAPGLADVLRRTASLREVMIETDDPSLTLVPAGAATPAEGQVFARSERLAQVLTVLERHTDHLILDLPPVLASSAAIPLARQAGSVALVVRQGVTTDAQVRAALDHLSPTPSAGIVLNRASSRIPRPILRRLTSW
jgi:Mrp family chromosome partitioning ATPase